ncbi:16S rRNA (uracil(1498)-N(3))-methyltransferase [Nitrosomonas sp. JL21]|nr:16S rRNA (uracil(1498)-N(3))-methyltransferase [Nitrosomonas sp. JL21]MBL8498555.1 16S rRNA (uracil(1498)-N(3))-methyltransferase [Nitrosomonas sp.]MCC7090427.1 16S rRNA (uracil(1498)-N(3))-methyltransferase [Nitrosomonas sp.]MXS79011.1 16S rRNA (uracil(1498)-N(3))-methyltransferase [Nitrosomonas sp. JL21]
MHARFYHPAEMSMGQVLELSHENKHHATRVLRLKKGNPVTLFNGRGGEFFGHIDHITKSSTTVRIESYHNKECESPLHIELAQAICVNEKMDWIIQKAVELGVTCIQPVMTTRSIVHLSDERSSKRLQHWHKIVIASCEQCGRNRLPDMKSLITLPQWLSHKKTNCSSNDLHLMLSPITTQSLRNIAAPSLNTNVALVIGPEGGFTEDEEAAISQAGFLPIRLGQRILRTETAALAAIAALQALWGDYAGS